MASFNGFIKVSGISKVKTNDNSAIDLLPYIRPLIKDSNNDPAKTGISVVGDGISVAK